MEELIIESEADLLALCQQIATSDLIAIDTEFMREKTYTAKLCLLQIATEQLIACVDPLALPSLDPLLDLLYQQHRVKILHSARQDLEIFFDLRGELPRPIFDTQIAATLLGYGDQLGYANLVYAMVGKTVDKEHVRTDWSRRPLGAAQLQYAMNDVRYLIPIYRMQQQRLVENGRDNWLQKDFEKLTEVGLYAPDPAQLWKRVKGTKNLKRNHLVVLQQLAIWREQMARQTNRPRKWIVPDDLLLDVARFAPATVEDLEKLRSWNTQFKKLADDILLQVKNARMIPEQQWPQKEIKPSLTDEQDAIVDLLMAIVRQCAIENDVTPAVLTNRKELESLVLGQRGGNIDSGWRYELAGHKLIRLLNGELSVSVYGNKLQISDQK